MRFWFPYLFHHFLPYQWSFHIYLYSIQSSYRYSIFIYRKIILASQSPRRLQILKQIGLQFEVNVSQFEENLDKSAMTPVGEYVSNEGLGRICEGKFKRKSHGSIWTSEKTKPGWLSWSCYWSISLISFISRMRYSRWMWWKDSGKAEVCGECSFNAYFSERPFSLCLQWCNNHLLEIYQLPS